MGIDISKLTDEIKNGLKETEKDIIKASLFFVKENQVQLDEWSV